MANNIQYGLKWSFDVVAIPKGAGPMSINDAQSLKITQGTAFPGQTPGGVISIVSTGDYPTTAAMTTALNAAATAGGVILNSNPALAQWQGFNSGGG